MDTNWNLGFTQMLRNSHPSYWGNWTLDARCLPGAVGILDPRTGSFQYLADLPSAAANDTSAAANDWKVQSSSVHETQASIDLDGSFTDPDTGTKVTAGLEVTWSFAEAGSISSTFTLAEQSNLTDFASQIMANHDWLLQQAQSVGMAANGQITQGFGVITGALMASCGLNLGAQNSSSTFSLKGSVGATNAMAGNAGANAKGSYATTNESAAFESHLWPSASATVASSPIPIAFEFASFVGDGLLPGWTTNVSDLVIQLDNAHGGTYIVDATASYLLGTDQHTITASVSGGMSNSMDPIPPEATNLNLDLSFVGVFSDAHHHFTWPTPLAQFPTGQIIIDLTGVWPGDTSAVERESGAKG